MPEVAEAPVAAPAESSTSVSSPISSGEVSSQSIDTSTDPGVESTGAESTGEPGQTTGGSDLSSIAKDATKREALKAIDPSLPGLIRDAAHGAAVIKKEFPQGGIKEAISYRDAIKQNGGLEQIQQTKQWLDNYDSLDDAYSEGKPEFVTRIAEGDPEAFERMVPMAIEQYAKQSPEQYQHVMSKVLVNTLDAARIPEMLEQLWSAADDNAKAVIQKIWDKIEGYRQISAKVPEKRIDPERQKLDAEKQSWQQQKIKDMESTVNQKSTAYRDSVIAREFKPFGDYQALDDDRKAAITREVRARTAAIVNADQGFKEQRLRFLQAGDMESVQRMERDFLNQHLPAIVPKVARLFSYNPGKKADPKPEVKNGKPAIAAPKGFQMLKSAPDSNKIDRRNTTRDMVMNNQAILIGGQKVQWA